MNTRILLVPLILIAADAQPAHIQQHTAGTCSPTVADVKGNVNITCHDVDKKLAEQMTQIVAASKRDGRTLKEISDRLDALLKEFRTSSETSVNQQGATAPVSVISNNQQGGITAGSILVNPLPPERNWEVSNAKCAEWVGRLNPFGPVDISVGAFISNNDGNRVVRILAACLARSVWKPSMAVLPANPDGVEIGASELGPKLDAVEWGLELLGLRITKRDIRAEYGSQIGIVIGTDPIKQLR